MAVISSLSILLKARTDKFKRNLKSAVTDLKKFGRSVKWFTGILAGMSAAMLGISAFRLKDTFRQVQKDADRVGKLSDEIGTTVNEMLGLEHAAKITGTSVEVMTRGLQRMNRRIGEAALGYGEGAKGLEQLGLKTEDLLKMGAFEQFKKIADTVNDMGNQGEKAAAVYALFGRQGQNLLNTFALGGQGLEDLKKQSENLLGVYDREEFRVFENMNDAAVRLGDSLKGFVLKLSQMFANRFGAALQFLTDMFVEIRKKHLESISRTVQDLVDRGLDGFARWSPLIVSIGQVFLSTFQLVGVAVGAMVKGFGMIFQVVSNLIGAIAWWWGASRGLNEELDDTDSILATLHKGFTGIAVVISRIPSMLKLMKDALMNISVFVAGKLALAFERLITHINFMIDKVTSGLSLMWKIYSQAKRGDISGIAGSLKHDKMLVEQLNSEYDKTLTNIESKASKALTLGEINEATGLLDNLKAEYDALLDGFERESRKKGGLSSRMQDFIDKLKNFKFPDPQIVKAAPGLERAAEKLTKFGQANLFGSQGAAAALAAPANRAPQVVVAAVKKGARDQEVVDLHKEEVKLLAMLNRRPPVTLDTVSF
jgi:hypothetical protein